MKSVVPCACALAVLIFGFNRLAAADWLPVDPADLAADHSSIDPEAGAEILYREETTDSADEDGTFSVFYYRIKVYNEKGVAALDKIDIFYSNDDTVTSIAARVIKRDGTIVNLDRRAFYTRDVVRSRGDRVRAKSFSFPGLEPGVIVEYRWTTVSEWIGGRFLEVQRDLPTRLARFRVRPYPLPGLSTNVITHRCRSQKPAHNDDGTTVIELEGLPAVKPEPYSPPENECRAWILFYFTFKSEKPDEFWQRVGRERLQRAETQLRPRKEIRVAAAPIVAGAANDLEKLTRLHDHCRTKIRNIGFDSAGFTPDQLEDLQKNGSPADTLKHGYGTSSDINLLFIALARATGFDARVTLCSDRSRLFFDPKIMTEDALRDTVVAVKLGDSWKFADPASRYEPFGGLRWQNEGTTALIVDARECKWIVTPNTDARHSLTRRSARLQLDDAGTLEGIVTVTFLGHEAALVKNDLDAKSPEEREDGTRAQLQRRLNGAEVSEVEYKNVADPLAPVSLSYRVRVPGYAEKTGQRLFLQPGYFTKGLDPWFPSPDREFDVYFSYPWSEDDEIVVTMPAGYELEEGNAPGSFPENPSINYKASIAAGTSSPDLRYRRHFDLRNLLFKQPTYAKVKSIFDEIHRLDAHTLVLKRVAEPAVADVTSDGTTSAP